MEVAAAVGEGWFALAGIAGVRPGYFVGRGSRRGKNGTASFAQAGQKIREIDQPFRHQMNHLMRRPALDLNAASAADQMGANDNQPDPANDNDPSRGPNLTATAAATIAAGLLGADGQETAMETGFVPPEKFDPDSRGGSMSIRAS